MTVAKLSEELTMVEYLGWVAYFAKQHEQYENAKTAPYATPNLLEGDETTLLKGFGL
jgi:hypothetical protein